MSVECNGVVTFRLFQLALIQTHSVVDQLKALYDDKQFEIVTMSTIGDKILDTALSKIGEKSLFTKELEKALEDNIVDFVVHSLKDLPTVLPEGMVVGAIGKRDSPYDAVVMHPKHKDLTLDTLPKDSVIGTSSLRRAAQLKMNYPHLKFKDVRGNLNTRLKKLDESDTYDALILAVAGLKRMGWQDRITHTLNAKQCLYAVSQGAIAIECRAGDSATLSLLSKLNHYETIVECIAERAFLKRLEGGCSVPVGVHTDITKGDTMKLSVQGGVFSIDGQESVIDTMETTIPDPDEPSSKKRAPSYGPTQFSCITVEGVSHDALLAAENLGIDLAEKMMKAGADKILKEAKQQTESEILRQKAAKEQQQNQEIPPLQEKNGHIDQKQQKVAA